MNSTIKVKHVFDEFIKVFAIYIKKLSDLKPTGVLSPLVPPAPHSRPTTKSLRGPQEPLSQFASLSETEIWA